MKPTEEEIQKAIEVLSKLKTSMPRFSAFGDDNHKMIDLEVQVLKGELRESDFYDHGDMIASSLLDVLEWKKGENKEWFDCRLDDLNNFKD